MFEPPRKEEFLDLFDVCVDGLFSRCHSRVPDRAEAIALVEETFMRGWNEVVKGNKVARFLPRKSEDGGGFMISSCRKSIVEWLYARTHRRGRGGACEESQENP